MKTAKFRASRSAKMRLLSLMLIMVMMLSLGFSGLAAAEELTDEPEEPSVETLAEIEEGEAVAEEPEEAGDPDEDMPAEDPAEESDGESQSVSESDPSDKSTDPAPEDAADPDPVEAERPTDPRQGEGLQELDPVEIPVALPAQDFECVVGDTLISASAPEGALPTGARMVVAAVTDEEILQTIGDTVDAESYRVTAFDITFFNAFGEPVEPLAAVSVTMKAAAIQQSEDPVVVVHMDDNGDTEVVEQTKNANEDEITFSADSFSIYAIITDTYRLKVIFHDANGVAQEPIYVKKGDNIIGDNSVVYDAGIGSTLTGGLLFRGWSKTATYTVADAESAMTIADVRADIKSIVDAGLEEDGQEYHLYPMIYKHIAVQYFNEKDVVIGSDSMLIMPSDVSTTYTVDMQYTVPSSDQNFEGWHVKAGGSNIDGYTADRVYTNGEQITISGDVDFSVFAPAGHWLIFDENGKGGTYNAPQFVKSGEVTVRPRPDSEMVRNGYTFGGWYTDAACTMPFTFGGQLTDNTTIYAKWIPRGTAPYTVIIWKQNVSGDGYDFEEAISLTGTVGTNVNTVSQQGTGNSAYARINGTDKRYGGFHLDHFTQNVEIKPEGNAVVHVYYDRTEYTLTFRAYIYTATTGNNGTQYGIVDGEYVELYRYNGRWYYGYWRYNGTRYTRSMGTVKEIKALYEQDISSNFPIVGTNGVTYNNGERWKPGDNTVGWTEVMVFIATMPSSNVTFTIDEADRPLKTMHYYVEALPTDTNTITHRGTKYVEFNTISARYNGVTEEDFVELDGFTKIEAADEPNGNTLTPDNNGFYIYDQYSDQDIYFFYSRDKFVVNYMDGVYVDGDNNPVEDEANRGQLHTSDLEYYGISMASYNKGGDDAYTPTYDEYVFEGWYLDSKCSTTPYTFTTMPEGGVTLYAKWRRIQYRVFLHPNAGTDSTLNWGSESQAMNFRVSIGGKVSAPTGLRSEYEFVGWYLDEACTRGFNANAYVLNETTVTAEYDKTTDFTDPMDKWGNGATTNGDLDRFWITKKLDLYAKWRYKLVGADGIGVLYDANGGSNAPSDTTQYLDASKAVAQAASTPPDNTQQFLYWVVQRWNGTEFVDTEEKVFPGAKFEVLKTNAHVVENEGSTAANPSYTYTVQLRAEYGPKESPTLVTYIFNANGGEFDNGDTEVSGTLEINTEINSSVPTADALSREGYTFVGWAASPDATEDDILFPTDTIYYADNQDNGDGRYAWDASRNANVLYAVWERTIYDITIKKVVTGNMGDVNKDFNVTVTCNEGETFTYNGTEHSASNPLVLTLKDGQVSGVLKVPHGVKLTIVESDYTGANGGYTAPVYTFTPATSTTETTVSATNYEITESGQFIITNDKDIIPDMGVRMTNSPFAMLLTMTILGGTGLLVRRKKEQDDEE